MDYEKTVHRILSPHLSQGFCPVQFYVSQGILRTRGNVSVAYLKVMLTPAFISGCCSSGKSLSLSSTCWHLLQWSLTQLFCLGWPTGEQWFGLTFHVMATFSSCHYLECYPSSPRIPLPIQYQPHWTSIQTTLYSDHQHRW